MEISIPLPESDEQKKIGEYFKNFNSSIDLHQREYFGTKKSRRILSDS